MLCTCILFAHFYGAFAISDCTLKRVISLCVVLIFTATKFVARVAGGQREGVRRGKLKEQSGKKGTPPFGRASTCSPSLPSL